MSILLVNPGSGGDPDSAYADPTAVRSADVDVNAYIYSLSDCALLWSAPEVY